MTPIDSVMQDIEDLCTALESRLEKQHQDLRNHILPDAAEAAAASAFLTRVRHAEMHLAGVAQALNAGSAPPPTELLRSKPRVQLMQKRVHQLLAMIGRNAAQCRQLRQTYQDALNEVQLGGQFLQSMRGHGVNRPKFLDAHQ